MLFVSPSVFFMCMALYIYRLNISVNPMWAEWVDSECTVSCGPGTRTRTRLCEDGTTMACLLAFPGTKHTDEISCSENLPCQCKYVIVPL